MYCTCPNAVIFSSFFYLLWQAWMMHWPGTGSRCTGCILEKYHSLHTRRWQRKADASSPALPGTEGSKLTPSWVRDMAAVTRRIKLQYTVWCWKRFLKLYLLHSIQIVSARNNLYILYNAHPITFGVNVRKISDEAERLPLWMLNENWNWSKFCFRKLAGNTSTGDEMGTSWRKQELAMVLTGLHVQLKLRSKENQKQC